MTPDNFLVVCSASPAVIGNYKFTHADEAMAQTVYGSSPHNKRGLIRHTHKSDMVHICKCIKQTPFHNTALLGLPVTYFCQALCFSSLLLFGGLLFGTLSHLKLFELLIENPGVVRQVSLQALLYGTACWQLAQSFG